MFDQAKEILKDHNIAPSFQRVKILEYLMRDDSHPTAETIHRRLGEEIPTLSKATVYNTLNLLSEKKLVSTMKANQQETRYDLLMEEHGHFVCNECGVIVNFPYRFRDHYRGLEGYRIEQEEIVVKGVCSDCMKKQKGQSE